MSAGLGGNGAGLAFGLETCGTGSHDANRAKFALCGGDEHARRNRPTLKRTFSGWPCPVRRLLSASAPEAVASTRALTPLLTNSLARTVLA